MRAYWQAHTCQLYRQLKRASRNTQRPAAGIAEGRFAFSNRNRPRYLSDRRIPRLCSVQTVRVGTRTRRTVPGGRGTRDRCTTLPPRPLILRLAPARELRRRLPPRRARALLQEGRERQAIPRYVRARRRANGVPRPAFIAGEANRAATDLTIGRVVDAGTYSLSGDGTTSRSRSPMANRDNGIECVFEGVSAEELRERMATKREPDADADQLPIPRAIHSVDPTSLLEVRLARLEAELETVRASTRVNTSRIARLERPHATTSNTNASPPERGNSSNVRSAPAFPQFAKDAFEMFWDMYAPLAPYIVKETDDYEVVRQRSPCLMHCIM